MWNVLIPALTTLAGMFMSNKGGDPQAQQANLMTPEMREMLQMQLQRMRGQEPLYNDVMGMARALLPTRYRGAMRPPAGGGLMGQPGTDGRQPTINGQTTGRTAIPRDVDDIARDPRAPRPPRY